MSQQVEMWCFRVRNGGLDACELAIARVQKARNSGLYFHLNWMQSDNNSEII